MQKTLVAWAIALLCAGTTLAGPSIIVNGSFENGTDPGEYLLAGPGATDIDGWDVSNGMIAYVGTRIAGSDGGRSVNLRNSGLLSQDFATEIGGTYLVTFDMAGYAGDPYRKTMVVGVSPSQYGTFEFDATNSTWANPGWLSQEWQFIAENATTTLGFLSTMFQWTDSNRGVMIDNVAVTQLAAAPAAAVAAVPAPAAVLLAGIGVGVTGWLRRRRSL